MNRLLVLTTLLAAVLPLLSAGCKERGTGQETISNETEVKDKWNGGTEIEKKEVIEQDGQYKVRKQETDLDRHGNVTEQKEETTTPDSDVDVKVDKDGVKVDVDK